MANIGHEDAYRTSTDPDAKLADPPHSGAQPPWLAGPEHVKVLGHNPPEEERELLDAISEGWSQESNIRVRAPKAKE